VSFRDQSLVVKWSAAVTLSIFLVGSLNSFFAFIVFNHRNTRQVGSGVYLLLSSIVSLLVVCMLTAKFWFVVVTRINPSVHRSILHLGCVLLEPGLRLFLYMNQWLNAFVAIERATAVFKRNQIQQAEKSTSRPMGSPFLAFCHCRFDGQ
jgi:hypothetical protein